MAGRIRATPRNEDHKAADGVKRLSKAIYVAPFLFLRMSFSSARTSRASGGGHVLARADPHTPESRPGRRPCLWRPWVTVEPNESVPAGEQVNRNRIARVMREHRLAGIGLRRRMKNDDPGAVGRRRFPDLIERGLDHGGTEPQALRR